MTNQPSYTYPSEYGLFTVTCTSAGFTLENNKTHEQYFFDNGYAMSRFLLCYYQNPVAALFAYEVQEQEHVDVSKPDDMELAYIAAMNETDNVIRDIFGD